MAHNKRKRGERNWEQWDGDNYFLHLPEELSVDDLEQLPEQPRTTFVVHGHECIIGVDGVIEWV